MSGMKYGVALPYWGARKVAEYARLVEDAGWDGVYLGDAVWLEDPLISLAAAAMTTERVRLGMMALAMPLHTPWRLASSALALDHLSEGRLTLGMATGATWMGWQGFPDLPSDTKTRAEILDEQIDILTRMFLREPFDFDGKHYHLFLTRLDTMYYPPKPVQQPRPPLWCVGVWNRKKSMQRVLKCDGIFPTKFNAESQLGGVTPQDIREIRQYMQEHRKLETPFDIVMEGSTQDKSKGEQQEMLCELAEAGATWWVESMFAYEEEQVRKMIEQGPPRVG